MSIEPHPTDYPRKFLKTLFGSHVVKAGLSLEVRCIHDEPNHPVVRRFYSSLGALKSGWTEIQDLNKDGYNIFFSVAPRNPKDSYKLPQQIFVTCFWCDIDVGPNKPNKSLAEASDHLRKCGFSPTITVKSGHGLHVYWCLKKPVTLEPSEARELLRALAEATGGDLQSAEPARLLRMPNTINWKSEKTNVLQIPTAIERKEAKQ